jgi:DNA polymerase-3 subunit epsilon
MAEHWTDGRMVGFDLETTSPDPEEARIVTAAIVEVGGGEPTVERTWLVDPGVEIPEQAAAIHGITTERARAEGVPTREAAMTIAATLDRIASMRWPLVIFNARYDLTVLDRGCAG